MKQKGEVYSELIENWRMFVGDELFSLSYPKKYLSSNKFRKSVLEVMVKRGHEVELEYSKKNIIDKINSFFGYDLISSLKVYTFDRTDEKPKNLKKYKSKINLGEIKNKKIENSLKDSTFSEEKLMNENKIIPPIKNLTDVNCKGDQSSIAIF